MILFARVVFRNKECVELLIQILFDDPQLKVIHYSTQYEFKNLKGRSIIVDLYVEDSKGRYINIEFQKSESGACAKRARFHESMMEGHISFPNEKWDEIAEVYIFFITEKDTFGFGKGIYHVKRKIDEVDVLFDDQAHIVYINGEHSHQEKINHLMHDLKCQQASEMYYEVFAREVRYYKESEKGRREMCEIAQKIKNDGKDEMRKEIVIRMLQAGKFSYEDISISTGMKVADVIALI